MTAQRKVLVVDDEAMVTRSCRRILSDDGYRDLAVAWHRPSVPSVERHGSPKRALHGKDPV